MSKRMLKNGGLIITALVFLAASVLIAAPAKSGSPFQTWPPKDFLIKSLVNSVGETLKTYHPETGRFGTEPWVCGDQNVLLPLAAAWSLKHPANPYYHDKKLLEVIAKGGEALVDDQDDQGKWMFRKKDYSTWGPILMPWTYSRWIRAYVLVKDALPKASRDKWEKGLLLGFTNIHKEELHRVHNIPCHHAMGLYIAGVAFKNEEWKKTAAEFQKKVVAKQDPEGYWSENSGPVVSYNHVYIESFGVYYSFSKDPSVLEALKRSVKYHSAVLWSDGSSASAIDERVIYHKSIYAGSPGFTFSPEGRGFILAQLKKQTKDGQELVGGDYAANMLLYSGKGPVVSLAADQDKSMSVIGRNEAVVVHEKPWEWAFSGYTTKPIQNRWIQDRQNHIDIFHSELGMIAGGGNSKLQPYWSTFTVGDPYFLRHKPGDEDPNFLPDVDLVWTADKATITASGNPTKMSLKYGDIECSVGFEVMSEGRMAVLTYEAPPEKRVEAHLPLMKVSDTLTLANGQSLVLSEKELVLDSKNIGRYFDFGKIRVTVPEGASLRWPCWQHNPYTKAGNSSLSDAKLVLVIPFEKAGSQSVTLSKSTN